MLSRDDEAAGLNFPSAVIMEIHTKSYIIESNKAEYSTVNN